MIGTMKQKRKQISDLALDLEVINPIESKTVLGGDWYNDGAYVWNDYHDYTDLYDYYTDLFGDGSGDYDYGSSGGGGGSYDQIPPGCLLTGLPTTVTQQIGNMCTFESFTFAAHLLGSNVNINTIITSLSQNPNIGPAAVLNGLTTFQISVGINNLFENTRVTSIAEIQTALCNNQPTLAVMGGHEITIVGYDSVNSTFTVADSQWSSGSGYHDISEGAIDLANAYVITGVRP
jgi:hypothetical protein